MQGFLKWLENVENIEYYHIDPEEDWDQAGRAYEIAKIVGIRPDSTKSPTIIASNNGDVVGAAFTSWSSDDDASDHLGEPVNKWQFDVVVHPNWQGNKLIGIKLIQQAERERRNLEVEFGEKAYTRLWVVNPKLAKLLQNKKFGYDVESEYPDGSAHLVKY